METNAAEVRVVYLENPIRAFIDAHPVICAAVLVVGVMALGWMFWQKRKL